MGRYLKISIFSLLLALAGCAAASPPASIPAPVSSLLAISPPGPTGAIDITGAPGAVLPDATVQAQNFSAIGPFTFRNPRKNGLPLVKSAYAQAQQIFFVEVTADGQGAFNLRIDGQSGDIIGVRQEVNGDFSPETQLTVP